MYACHPERSEGPRPGGDETPVFQAQTPPVAQAAVDAGAEALWLQLGIVSEAAREIAVSAGLAYVEDRCLAIEIRRHGLTSPRR